MRPMRWISRAMVGSAVVLSGGCAGETGGAGSPIELLAISAPADRVSGGDLLVEVRIPSGSDGGTESEVPTEVTVSVGGEEGFRALATEEEGRYLALVTGLPLGESTLQVDGAPWGVPDATLLVTNYPASGPIVSGPHLEPFVCQTELFELPDGTRLGAPLDEDCTVPTRVQYVYRSATENEFLPFPTGGAAPADVATTVTTEGFEVPFIVRVETGSMNRGIYQNAILHDPRTDPEPTPLSVPPAWNGRLIAVHGSGCTGGWYRQGAAMGVDPLGGANVQRLGEGYAVFTNTLNHPSNSCNPIVAGEATMMGKERFIETFGPPLFTVSIGGSGGAYTGLQVADAFPGLIDGVIATSTFPDALSLALSGLDAHLLRHYLRSTAAGRFTDEEIVAISGYSGVRAFEDAADQAARTDPVPDRVDVEGYASARWNGAIPESVRYDPVTNPRGARPTVFDVSRNVYGVDPATGFALRPFDNVGVQYGLAALNSGVISTSEFLDLNEGIGGYDQDANYVPTRSVGDRGAIRRAYQTGASLSGAGGLATIPVFDAGGYNDTSGYHYQWFHFAVRERMRKANGYADNHLMWRGAVPAEERWNVMMEWLSAIASDSSPHSDIEKLRRNRPPAAVDGCWIEGERQGEPARFLAEPQTFSSEPTTPCNAQFPSYSFTRGAAGGPLDGNILKCSLRPIDLAEYRVSFSAGEAARLRSIFPDGVCDWSRPGVEQTLVVPWPSLGPAPENLIP